MMSLAIDDVIVDPQFQPRAKGLDAAHVDELVEAYRADCEIEPIRVYKIEGRGYVLTQGFHRLAAQRKAGRKTIQCEVRTGTVEDAICDAAKSNARHGLKRTTEDKHRALQMVLAIYPNWSNTLLADACGTSEEFVRKNRPRLPTVGSQTPAKRVGKDGREYTSQPKQNKQPEPVKQVTPIPPAKSTPVRVDAGIVHKHDELEQELEPEDVAADLLDDPWAEEEKPVVFPAHETKKSGQSYTKKDGIPDIPGVYRPRFVKTPEGMEKALDAFGQPVPNHVGDVFGDTRLRSIIADVRVGMECLERAWQMFGQLKRANTWPWVQYGEAMAMIAAVRNKGLEFQQALVGGVPYAVCPGCAAKRGGCKECRTCGYWPREEALAQADRFPKTGGE